MSLQGTSGSQFQRASVCILSRGRKANDERIYYKIARSLRKRYEKIVVIAPGDWDHRFDDDIEFVSIPKRRSRWNRISTLRGLFQKAKERPASIYQCEEVDSWLIGWLVARKSGARLVFDAHEFDPAAVAGGAPGVIRGLLWLVVIAVERFLSRRTHLILVANDIVRGYFLVLNRFVKVVTLENVPVLALFKEGTPSKQDNVLLCHEGSLGFNRGLKAMVRLVDRLRQAGVNVRLRIVGDVYGDERSWLEGELQRRNLGGCIETTGWLKYPEVGKAVEGCHLGLITMHPLASNMLSGHPNKLFNYMRYGLAVVAPDFPEITRIVRKEQCGLIYAAGGEDGLFEAVMELVKNEQLRATMGLNGKRAVLREYNWDTMEQRLLGAYSALEQADAEF